MEKSTHFVVQCVEKNRLDAGIDFVIQPIFDLSRFVCIGGEVLVRGTHRRNIVPPNLFISQLEETGGILPMGDYVMAQAFKFIARQPQALREYQLFTLNISQVQLNDVGFAARAIHLMQQNHLSPRHFIFEITDSVDCPDDAVRQNLAQLSEAGIHLAWDGIDGLDTLKARLAVWSTDYIKLDRSCLAAANIDHTFLLLDYINELDIDVIIEGVENYTHVSTMLRHGVKYGQGFLFSRPLSKEHFHQEYMQPEH
ncbi:EAL domain-containing protein [Lelliottia sp. V106_10]|uniref:EAL domain-containing protein n=1 Tax=Lelliottia wanjuensis TaxID=3050585 RepID=UPI00255071E4|nr:MULTISPECIES: EAL domain-containing protein [unclassified Lelliottia]MDK9357971.1 EAL domain-containing protein [Lelliottia sp. V106_16]MDK9374961.1 EAL domain-containing protein [Lelliottia sp. V106_10]MDK9600652.1 EAL domain-containing protein [Lelliottia sp. V106_5]